MKLVHKETGIQVKIGDRILDFRGDQWTLVSVEEPAKVSSTGRVYVRSGEYERGFFPGVFDLVWVTDDAPENITN